MVAGHLKAFDPAVDRASNLPRKRNEQTQYADQENASPERPPLLIRIDAKAAGADDKYDQDKRQPHPEPA